MRHPSKFDAENTTGEGSSGDRPSTQKNIGPRAFAAVLESLRLKSLVQVNNLKTLKEVVVALEAVSKRGIR